MYLYMLLLFLSTMPDAEIQLRANEPPMEILV